MSTENPEIEKLKQAGWLRGDAFSGGEWLQTRDRFSVRNPATGLELAAVANLGAQETEQAIAAAAAAFGAWSSLGGKERADILRRWHALMLAHADELAALMTAEQGKPLIEAKGEVQYGASFI